MTKKKENKKGFLLLEALVCIITSTAIMYYFSSYIAHAHTQYKKTQLYNHAQQTLYTYTKQAQISHNPLIEYEVQEFCDCEFVIKQKHIPVENLDFLLEIDLQYIQTTVSWNDKNDNQALVMNVIPWNMKDVLHE